MDKGVYVKKIYLMHFLLSFFIISFLISCSASDPLDSNDILKIPPQHIFELGNGWATNTVNTVIFRHHGIVSYENYQFTAFYDSQDSISIVKRTHDSKTVDFFKMAGYYDAYDAHNTISLGLDRAGYLHISYDHHGDELNYRRSQKPLDIMNWTENLTMTGYNEDRVTYPTFLMPLNSEEPRPLLFLYRRGSSSAGEAYLKRYDETEGSWQDLDQPILKGTDQNPWTSNAYWNHPAVDNNGNLHLSFVWRTHSLGEEKRINNINIDYALSPDWGETWYTSNGYELQLPITQVNSETVFPVSPGSNLINQCSSAADSKGRLHIAFYSNDLNDIPQYQHLWFDGKQWHHSFISQRTAPFSLEGGGTLQIPISRPEIIIDKNDYVYIIFRGDITDDRMAVKRLTPPEYKPPGELRILWDDSLGFAEPIIDRLYWQKTNILSMLIQKNEQPPHDINGSPLFEPIYIVDWDLTEGW